MSTIHGPTGLSGPDRGYEVHGIMAYGANIAIEQNTVHDVNEAQDHEAIYMKARESRIVDNVVTGSGSGRGGADITVKGGDESRNNVVSGNLVVSELGGRAMLLNGGTTVTDNYVRKPNGGAGVDLYAYGRRATITGNVVEVPGSAVYLHEGMGSVITDNVLVSYDAPAIRLNDATTDTTERDNTICEGHDCMPLDPPGHTPGAGCMGMTTPLPGTDGGVPADGGASLDGGTRLDAGTLSPDGGTGDGGSGRGAQDGGGAVADGSSSMDAGPDERTGRGDCGCSASPTCTPSGAPWWWWTAVILCGFAVRRRQVGRHPSASSVQSRGVGRPRRAPPSQSE